VRGPHAVELRDLLGKLRTSEACLADPITLFASTGLRRSELLALRWEGYDYHEEAGRSRSLGRSAGFKVMV